MTHTPTPSFYAKLFLIEAALAANAETDLRVRRMAARIIAGAY